MQRLTDILFRRYVHNLRLAVAPFNMRSSSKYSFSSNKSALLDVALRKA